MSETKQKPEQKEQHVFQTEVKQLLKLMINALYSNKEIFLRELVSNASDANDKLRYHAVTDGKLYEDDPNLEIHISFDKAARTLTVTDNGIGMTHAQVIAHLGTIAKSGTREFLDKLSGDKAKDATLIGQFGVGFYAVFIVADSVSVRSRAAGVPAEQGVLWQSEGAGEFTVEYINKLKRGTEITLHLKADQDEFLESYRLRSIITKYSDHISFPVLMEKAPLPETDTDTDTDTKTDDKAQAEKQEQAEKTPEWEAVNRGTALWTRPKQEIKKEEYQEFYKSVTHDYQDALYWTHNRVEGGSLDYTSLLYIPGAAPYDLWQREKPRGLKLYVQRVFIMDEAEQFLPLFLRFMRGIIDTNALSLNVSRELLQNNRVVKNLRNALTKKVLSMLETLAKDQPENYDTFWHAFGAVLKEGPAEDFANKARIAKLLRFATTMSPENKQTVSLETYLSRMKEKQDKIYYLTAGNYEAAKSSPHLEVFAKKGIEVLLLTDPVDEWLVSHLTEFEGKSLQSVAKGSLDLGALEEGEVKSEQEAVEKEYSVLVDKIQKLLSDEVKTVRITHRLTDSPACVVVDDNDMGPQMQRMLKAAGQVFAESKPILELNPEHAILRKLKSDVESPYFEDWAHLLFEQAILAEGGQLKAPADFVKRLNNMLVMLA